MLDDYDPPAHIGIYGCSAGAMLTAQAVAYALRHELPVPGAIGLFCAGIPMTDGDNPGVFKMGPQRKRFPGLGDQRLRTSGRTQDAAPGEGLF